MSLYTYSCEHCNKVMDKVFPIKDCPRTVECISCRRPAKKILVVGHGGFQSTEPSWLSSACDVLQPDNEPKLESRTEYNKYLKDRGLIPIG